MPSLYIQDIDNSQILHQSPYFPDLQSINPTSNQQCRICLADDTLLHLLKPCSCLSYVHQQCLLKWITTQKQRKKTGTLNQYMKCEVCLQPYDISIKYSFNLYCPSPTQQSGCLCRVFIMIILLLLGLGQIIVLILEEFRSVFWKDNPKLQVLVIMGILACFSIAFIFLFKICMNHCIRKQSRIQVKDRK